LLTGITIGKDNNDVYGLVENTIKQLVAKKINSSTEPDWHSSYDEDELNVENAGKGFFNVFAVQAWHSSHCEDHVDGCGGEPVATVKVDYDRDTKKPTLTLYKLEEYRGGRWIHGERMDIEPVTADIAAYIQGQKEDLQRELEKTTKLLQKRLDDLEEDTIKALEWASGGRAAFR
jgi:hypothetical protein